MRTIEIILLRRTVVSFYAIHDAEETEEEESCVTTAYRQFFSGGIALTKVLTPLLTQNSSLL